MPKIAFERKEVDSDLTYPAMFPGMPPNKKYNTPITPKENYRLLYSRKLPVWLPVSADSAMMTPRIDPDNIARAFAFEANPLSPEEMVGGKDRHGIDWVYVPSAGGSMVKPGNPVLKDVNDWEKVIQFPDIEAWDWEGSAKSNEEYLDGVKDRFFTITILTGFFERLISFMDFENAAVALIDEDQQDAVHALFSKLADLYIKMIDKYHQYFKPDCISLHDDWGSQRSPFFSLNTVLEMIVPYIKRVVDHCHSLGIFYDQHSCGKNEKLVPAYIAAGVDSWSGQTMNDKDWIYENYGDKLILGIEPDISIDFFAPNPVLPTDEESAEAARKFINKFGPNFLKKPVLPGFFFGPAAFSDTLYEESRKLFYELAQ
jgi:hypothetical protein